MRILITGGASGLGEAITTKLASNPDNFVFFTYCRSLEKASLLEKKFSNVKALHVDFTNPESLNNLLITMSSINLEVLINNALSVNNVLHFHKIKANDISNSFMSNVLPVITIKQRAVELFRKSKFGKIITVLSSAIINKPPIGWSTYVAEKNYLLSISKSIAVENATFNITSNCVSPSFMLTNLNSSIDERIVEEMIVKHPLKNILTTNETADAVLFLVGASQHINGINMVINSGSDIV